MCRLRLLILCLSLTCAAQPRTRLNLAETLGFENGKPAGWSFPENAALDDDVKHSGGFSARLIRAPESSNPFSTITTSIAMDFMGSTIEWRGFIKTEDVREFVALWMRVDGDTPTLAFATLQPQKIDGTRDWKEYSITVPAVPQGKRLFIGFLLAGPGKAWVDDLQLLVDGKPIAQAAARPIVKTALDEDHEFDAGSKFTTSSLNPIQIKNLVTLGKVWGFLKYHHPAVTGGTRHWDYDLFRILPAVSGAPDQETANAAILAWIKTLGEVPACTACVTLDAAKIQLKPDLDWIDDQKQLGTELSNTLRSIHRNRKATQFYISLTPNVGNPVFENEPPYAGVKFPDAGYQLLALFRFWNMVHYFYPARDTMADSPAGTSIYWHRVLEEAIPRITLASSKTSYQQELIRFIAKINDSHANLWSSLDVRPPIGTCQLPVFIRFIEGKPIVIRYTSGSDGPASGLQPGDIVTGLDGVPVVSLVNEWRPLYAASNEPARLRDIGENMTRGACGPAKVDVLRGDKPLALDSNRITTSSTGARYHDRPGPTFQKLSPDVAYLKLSSVKIADAATYIRDAADTKGLVIDIRNYPSEFVVFALGSLLHKEKTPFVLFTGGDPSNPGAVRWGQSIEITPGQPHYAGKIVILVDERTLSQAEYTAMAFRAVPGAIVVGSTTSGADGNVSRVPLPGGVNSAISGLGVLYPDKRPTQRVGIKPDIWVVPTIEGIRAGRDEVLEEALRQIK